MKDDPWKTIPRGEMRRVQEIGRFDYFWGSLASGQAALILLLPVGMREPSDLPKLRNLEISFSSLPQPMFMIALKDASHRNIFSTLCHDIVTCGERAGSAEDAFHSSLARARRWHFLLKAGENRGLSVEEQRGLIGELACLRKLTASIGPAAAAEAWRGPEGAPRDFELPNLAVEVKAKREGSRPFVQISSVEQLADLENGRVVLRVYDVQNAASPEGQDLHDHVEQTVALFKNHDRAAQRIDLLLQDYGYDPDSDYGDRRWIISRCSNFRVEENFPRVTPPLSAGVSNLKYDIALDSCEAYRCSCDPLENVSQINA